VRRGSRIRLALAAALAVIAALNTAACSSRQETAEGGAHSSSAAASAHGSGTSSRNMTSPSPSPSFTTPSVKSLPQRASWGRTYPRLGSDTTPMVKGYSGQSFIDKLSSRWDLNVSEPKKEELPGARKILLEGGKSKNGEFLQVYLTPGHTMSALGCGAHAGDPKGERYIRDCLTIDLPGVDHAKAAQWIDRAEKEVDGFNPKKKEWVVSSPFLTDHALMLMDRTRDGSHELRILGGAVAEVS
jgi:hypothetical protein